MKNYKKYKNPVPYTPENVRRWIIVNFPKFDPDYTGQIQTKINRQIVVKEGEKYFNLNFLDFFEDTLIPYLYLWKYICKLNISKLEKNRYWRYYAKTKELAFRTGDMAYTFFRDGGLDLPEEASDPQLAKQKFLEYLRKNYDKDRPLPLKNPLTPSRQNIRRWAIVNIPKYNLPIQIDYDELWEPYDQKMLLLIDAHDYFTKGMIEHVNNRRTTVRNRGSGSYPDHFDTAIQYSKDALVFYLNAYLRLWNYIIIAPIPKLFKIKYWKLLTVEYQKSKFAGTHAQMIYRSHDKETADKLWIKWLQNHEK